MLSACLCIVGRNWIALVALVRAQSGKRNECTGCCDIVGGLKNFAGFCADHSSLVAVSVVVISPTVLPGIVA